MKYNNIIIYAIVFCIIIKIGSKTMTFANQILALLLSVLKIGQQAAAL
jgi:hypothetical protein